MAFRKTSASVRRVVGRFLEHSRIFFFDNGGTPEVYAGSADWMPRNLYERCEVVFPVTNPAAAHRLRHEILEAYLRDNVKARLLDATGNYVRAPRPKAASNDPALSAQDWFMQHSRDTALCATPNTVEASRPSQAPEARARAPQANLAALQTGLNLPAWAPPGTHPRRLRIGLGHPSPSPTLPGVRRLMRRCLSLSCLLLTPALLSFHAEQPQAPIRITADLTDAPRKLFHAEVDLPVHAGPLKPCHPGVDPPAPHGPDGPIHNITGGRLHGRGQNPAPGNATLSMSTSTHLTVPAGVAPPCTPIWTASITAPPAPPPRWSGNALMLYPANTPVHGIAIQPTVIVPAHWGHRYLA